MDRPCLRAPSVPRGKGTDKGASVPSVPPIGAHGGGHGQTRSRPATVPEPSGSDELDPEELDDLLADDEEDGDAA